MALNAELTLQDYWRILHRRRGIFALTWAACVAATFVFTKLQTPVYQAQGVIKIEASPAIPGMRDERGYDIWTLMNTEVKSVKSLEVSRRAASLLGWIKEDMPHEDALRLADALSNQIQSERMGESNLIGVSVLSDNPKKAAAIVNAVMVSYIQKGIEDRSVKARETKEFTYQELEKAESRLRQAEEELKRYSQRTGARGMGQYLTSERVTLQSRLDDLTRTYTTQHPEVTVLRAKIATVDQQLRRLPQEEIEYQRLVREARLNEDLYSFLSKKYKESQIAEAEREQLAFRESEALVPERPLRPDLRVNLVLGAAVGLFLGLVAVLLGENLDTSIGTIEDVERFVELPVLAVVPHIRVGAEPFFFGLGRPGNMDEMRRRLVMYHPTQSSFAEAYHTLRTNLRFPIRPGARPAPVVGFTSATASEGKTLTAVNFALTSAQSGLKTLFIEADLRRPFAHKLLGMPREPGLVDAVMGHGSWSGAVKGTSDFLFGDLKADMFLKSPGIENFRLLPCGPSPLNPADILGSPRMERILQEVKTQFDLIVIDCAPVMLFADALLVGPRADAVVLVHKAGRTARGALKRAKDQLVNVKTKVVGVVLNDLRASEMQPQYGYYYSYDYEPNDDPRRKK
jgi:capsular exopolysaccharide synthesis family protein